ncbi:MAG: phosphoglucosamine mutase, partial [Rhodopirellula bahusiensis]
LADELPQLSIHKSKAGVSAERLPAVFDKLEAKYTDAEATRGDGMRLQWSDRWLLVRGSNTEPIVRMIAEAPTAEEAALLCDQAAELLG